jgi:DNA-binding transcriptional LysR family regulator
MRGTHFAEFAGFVAIAEQRSFAKAAMQIGISRSRLSQNLRALEERLGVRLLNRTTRSVSVTEAGIRLLTRVRPALEELKAAAGDVDPFRHGAVGELRLVVQPPVASLLIGPILKRFLTEHPGIRLDVAVVKMPGDITREGFDAGIRFGEQVDRDMIAIRVLGAARFLVVGSPEYLAHHPAPKTPRDLKNHDCIRARLPNGTIFGWQFEKNGKSILANVEGRLIIDDIDLSIRAALDGVGLSYLLYDFVKTHISDGTLIPMLEDWSPQLSGFFLYHSTRRQVSGPLRALISFLKSEAKRRGLSPSTLPRSSVHPNYRLVGTAKR